MELFLFLGQGNTVIITAWLKLVLCICVNLYKLNPGLLSSKCAHVERRYTTENIDKI